MKSKIKVLSFIAILTLIAPLMIRAADTPGDTTVPATPAPRKVHHRHKKKASGAAAPSKTVDPVSAADKQLHTGVSNNTDASGMSDSLGTNNAGSPNMGSSDHVPGTTGTSGQ